MIPICVRNNSGHGRASCACFVDAAWNPLLCRLSYCFEGCRQGARTLCSEPDTAWRPSAGRGFGAAEECVDARGCFVSNAAEERQHLIRVVENFASPEDAIAACRRRFKNLPERHFRSLELLVRQHFERRSSTAKV